MKKIMFNDKYGLTQAVLEGKKTQTRRIITPQPTYKDNCGICWKGYAYGINPIDFKEPFGSYMNFVSGTEYNKSCRRYRKGEVIAVAQSYKTLGYQPTDKTIIIKGGKIEFIEFQEHKEWNNKMFVSCENMLHFIRITNVRIHRLQDISDEDCLAEGIQHLPDGGGLKPYAFYDKTIKVKSEKEGISYGWYRDFDTPREAYAALIDKVGKKGDWDSNPYVWAYTFELVK